MNILSAIREQFTPQLLGPISRSVGESPEATKSAVEQAVPALLRSAVAKAATPEGATSLFNLLKDKAPQDGWASAASSWLGNLTVGGGTQRNNMNNMKSFRLGLICAALLIGGALNAADSKTYQVTGPVLDVTPTTITVQKGNDKWEIARDNKTKVTGDLKTGAKVTIYYTMVASEVEVKTAKGSNDAKTKGTKAP